MIKRKKLIKRIGAVLCALVVAVSSMFFSVSCCAMDDASTLYQTYIDNYVYKGSVSIGDFVAPDVNKNYAVYYYPNEDKFYCFITDADCVNIRCTYSNSSRMRYYLGTSDGYYYYTSIDLVNWSYSNGKHPGLQVADINKQEGYEYSPAWQCRYVCSNVPICVNGFEVDYGIGNKYNPSLGYLLNVSRKSTYIRGALYNYDEDSLTYHWYHDLQSTSGVDLTSGEYKIRHYISNATVKGYEKEDIVEMSEKYLMAEYDASQGYFSYLQKDYLDMLIDMGYEELGFIDTVFKGLFTLQHHYFQIVNTSTNEVGGYLHFYPKDATGDSFGVEMEFEGLDDNFDVDENGPSGYIDTSTGSGETIEDALENADQPKLDDLGGIEPLIESLEGYASQVGNVTSGVGALLGALPPWVVGLLGLSVAMLFVVIVVKALRG